MSLKQMFRKLPKHQPVAIDREMIISENVEMFVPILVGVSRGEENRIQIYECLATVRTEIAPERNLPAVAIALCDLLRPGVNHDRQGNFPRRQQVAQRPHVLQRSRDAAAHTKRLIAIADVEAGNRPTDAGVIGVDRPPPVAEKGLNRSLD